MSQDSQRRVLIVEDDRRTQDALKKIFTYRGWEVESATSTREGLMKLDPPPRCVLMDLSLPDGAGERILHAIRMADQPIRVVVCTGCNDPAQLAAVQEWKPDALLVKPVDPDELLRACEDEA